MKLQKMLFVLIILFASFQICFGQELVENENWIGEIERGQPMVLIHSFKNYTKEDVLKAKEKLNLIRNSKTDDEWEGSYSLFGDLTDNKLFWDSEIGFVNYYIYTCALELRGLNYGRAINNFDSVTLFSEKQQPPLPGIGKIGQRKFVKVKWGDRHYLVDEEILEDFCELAAGYYEVKSDEIEINGEKIETQVAIWNSFWVMSDDSYKKKVFGLPVLPKSYEKYIKQPIKTKIAFIGKIEKDIAKEDYLSSSITYYLTLGAGKDKGIKEGMSFYIPQLKERVSIEKVNKKTSIASLARDYDTESQKENCIVIGEEIPCVNPTVGMEAKTIPAELLEDYALSPTFH